MDLIKFPSHKKTKRKGSRAWASNRLTKTKIQKRRQNFLMNSNLSEIFSVDILTSASTFRQFQQ